MVNVIRCDNHTCQLNSACQNYFNLTHEVEAQYIRPKMTFDGFNTPKFKCDYLLPLNVSYIVGHYMRNQRMQERLARVKLDIVEQFGGENKVELMKMLNKLCA